MASYVTPGVYRELWQEEPVGRSRARDLPTGVPGFLGFVTADQRKVDEVQEQNDQAEDILKQNAIVWRSSPIGSGRALGRRQTLRVQPPELPERYTRWAQFEATLGSRLSKGYTNQAVKGFFANGGRLCYVHIVQLKGTFPTDGDVASGLEAFTTVDDVDLICVPDIMWPVLSIGYSGSDSTEQAVLDQVRAQFKEKSIPLGINVKLIELQVAKRWKIIDNEAGNEKVYYVVSENQQLRIYADFTQLQNEVLRFCDTHSRYLAILDSQPGADIARVSKQRSALRGDNGALYYPWIKVPNGPPITLGYIPPCGHVAAIYARSDEREGVHKAPANEALVDVIDLEEHIDNAAQAELNPVGVNCIRAFPGRGIRIWGARTLSTTTFWTYVNVRRIFLTAARWIDLNMDNYAFEPHTPDLWARITRDLNTYFTALWRKGALVGNTPEEAFFVNCNAETNPQTQRDLGQVVTEIGLAPSIPSEFIVVRIIQHASGVSIVGPGQLEA